MRQNSLTDFCKCVAASETGQVSADRPGQSTFNNIGERLNKIGFTMWKLVLRFFNQRLSFLSGFEVITEKQ